MRSMLKTCAARWRWICVRMRGLYWLVVSQTSLKKSRAGKFCYPRDDASKERTALVLGQSRRPAWGDLTS
eukprot:scaffold116274_cov31-Tisochrysis_lutea.AAC.3